MTAFNQDGPDKSLFNRLKGTLQEPARKLSQSLRPVERMATGGAMALGFVPDSLQANALEPILNHAMRGLIDNGELDFLADHCCAIALKERDLAWHICFDGVRLSVRPDRLADVTIRATVPAFLALISQTTDPDTLFFQRQLAIEGDVELGLYVKNMLDALDEDDLPLFWRQSLSSLRQLLILESR